MQMIRSFAVIVLGLHLGACASLGTVSHDDPSPPKTVSIDDPQRNFLILSKPSDYEKDRAAILSMLGEYKVTFDFKETVALDSGYSLHEDKEANAYETVVLVEDQGGLIVLQHLLVSESGGKVIKHWRQDWHFEARERLVFTEDQTWRIKPMPEDRIKGHWTQCVYEVSDAPRYCGTGQWIHRYGSPTWTSDRSWRPLPRREYTKRSDYNALNVENRHTITPGGWTHEQDNTKTIRDGEKTQTTLVREFGFNDYRKISGFDFQPAYEYWEKTKGFWSQVRQQWSERIAAKRGISLNTKVDGVAIIGPMFAQAAKIQKGRAVSNNETVSVFEAFTAAPGQRKAPTADADVARGESEQKEY